MHIAPRLFEISRAWETSAVEEDRGELAASGGGITAALRANGVVTVRLSLRLRR